MRLWLIDQVTILAEVFGEELTEPRLRVYAEDLSELPRQQLEIAFVRARHELKFFPKISELRELADAKPEDARDVEANAAWNYTLDYLRKWGVGRMPVYSGGKRFDAPQLPAYCEYALRRIGGLWALNQITATSRPFVKKDFIEAYNQAPIAAKISPQLAETFGDRKLLGQVKQLASGKQMAQTSQSVEPGKPAAPAPIKRVAVPMTDAQLRDRREMLRQQVAQLHGRSKNPLQEGGASH